MRILLARRASTGQLLPLVDTAGCTPEVFAGKAASHFKAPAEDLHITEHQVTDEVLERIYASLKRALPPFAFLWPDGDQDASIVSSAATVDAVTDARINTVYGGEIQRRTWGDAGRRHHWASSYIHWQDGTPVTLAEKEVADAYISSDHVLSRQVDRIVLEGRTIKTTLGWA